MGLIFTRFRFLNHSILLLLVLLSIDSVAAIRTSVQSGNWNDAATWGGTIPVAGDQVIIAGGTTVSLNVTTPNLTSLIISSTGNLTVSVTGVALNISGDFTNDGSINLWQSETIQAEVVLQANSTWFGAGTWNLSGINLQNFALEFGSPITLTINRSILTDTGGKLNSGAQMSAITFNFYGTVAAVIPSAGNKFYYGNINLDKGGIATLPSLTFSNSAASNGINLLGDLHLDDTNDRLYIGLWNVLVIDNGLSGLGYLLGDNLVNGPSITIGGNGPALTLNIISANSTGIFRDFKITRPSGVTINSPTPDQIAFRFNFTIDNSTVTIGDNVLLKVGSTQYFPSGNLNLLNGGRFIGGANASFDLSGDALLSGITFDESSQNNQTLKNFTLTKSTGTGELKSNLRVTNNFNLSIASSSFSIGPHTLTLNGSVTNTGSFRGSSASNLVLGGTTIGSNTFRFLQTDDESRTLKSLSISRTGVSLYTFSLTNSLNVTDGLIIGALNRLDVDGNTILSLKGAVTGAGDIGGSATGELVIDNPTAAEINPLRILSGTSFKSLTSKRTAGVFLGASLTIRDLLSLENTSKLTLPANGTLTLGVSGTTPTPGMFTGDGFLAGSATSNLSVRGSAPIAGIRFSQSGTENRINNFTIAKTTGSVNLLNSNLFVEGELNIADNNNLSIGTGTLTLKGLNLTHPAS